MGDVRDLISLGVLGSFVPRDVVDEAIRAEGKGSKRSGGKLPPWVVVYLTMLMGLHPDEDYEELAVLVEPLASWGGESMEPATSGAVAQARKRLGPEVVQRVFEQVAGPVAEELTPGAFLGSRRLLAVDGFELDVPETPENVAEFGYAGSGANRSAYPKTRVLGLVECGSGAAIAATHGPIVGKGSGERTMLRDLLGSVGEGDVLLADSGFYSFEGWAAAVDTGADLAWRVGAGLRLPVVEYLADGSYLALITRPGLAHARRDVLLAELRAAAASGVEVEWDAADAHLVRVVEYTVPDRHEDGELICVLTTILDPDDVDAPALAGAYHARWEAEGSFDQVKNHLTPTGKVLRSKTPEMVTAEIFGILLTQWAIAKLICEAATEANISPHRVKYARTLRTVRRHATSETDFSP